MPRICTILAKHNTHLIIATHNPASLSAKTKYDLINHSINLPLFLYRPLLLSEYLDALPDFSERIL